LRIVQIINISKTESLLVRYLRTYAKKPGHLRKIMV
jgi:hypothetical protein